MSYELLTVNEAAKILTVSRRTVYRFMDQEGLPYVMVGARRRVRRGDLDAWIESRRAQPATAKEEAAPDA